MPLDSDDRKKDAVYRTIMGYFLSGRYRFGDPVSVKSLSESIGVSRQPVMAALNRLSLEGFVTITAQVGCQVIAPTSQEISDFFLLFSRIEGVMAELAAARRASRNLRAMHQANAGIKALVPTEETWMDYRDLNRIFHTAVHECSRSPALTERSQSAWTMSDFLIAQTYGFVPHLEGAALEHDAIISAIDAQDTEAARSAAEHHILNVGRLVTDGLAKEAA